MDAAGGIKLRRQVDFDPEQDLRLIMDLARRWRSLFRPSRVSYTPAALLPEMEALGRAHSLRLYIITNPAQPLPLAILAGLNQNQALEIMALASNAGPDLVRPFQTDPIQRRELMKQAPKEPSGQGVYAFLLGSPNGAAWLDLEPEGLVLALARFGDCNVLDPEPLLAQRMRRLGQAVQRLAAPGEPDLG